MARKDDHDEFADFVVLTSADSTDEAEFIQQLLGDHGIDAIFDEDIEPEDANLTGRIPILVPEDMLADATDFIEQRTSLDHEFDEEFVEAESDSEDFEGFEELDI